MRGEAAPGGSPAAGRAPGRLLSLDLLRGLVVLLMLFVNQADSVEGASDFLRHAGEAADTVTLADLVLPAFLFMVGMSIPFALGSRLRREGPASALRHVLARTAALVVIGVLMVNADVGLPIGPLAPRWWGVLAIVAALLLWQAPPDDAARRPPGSRGVPPGRCCWSRWCSCTAARPAGSSRSDLTGGGFSARSAGRT